MSYITAAGNTFTSGQSKDLGDFKTITGIDPLRVVSIFSYDCTVSVDTSHSACIYVNRLYFGVSKACTVIKCKIRILYI